MVEITEEERKIVEVMRRIGATSKDEIRSMDRIARAATMPKPRVANLVHSLIRKKIIKKVARTKAPGYFLLRKDV
jgi:DNA-binding IclR family transcriptional regulator